jgi:hypothetical protein
MRELSLHILDIAMNAIEAQASRLIISIEERKSENYLRIRLRDNGKGIPKDLLETISDPFTTSRKERTVGLGIPLFKQAAISCNGHFNIRSMRGRGTELDTGFVMNHVNRAPMGDIEDTIVNIAICSTDIHLAYLHQTDFARLLFDSYWIFARMADNECVKYQLGRPLKEHLQQELKRIKSDI